MRLVMFLLINIAYQQTYRYFLTIIFLIGSIKTRKISIFIGEIFRICSILVQRIVIIHRDASYLILLSDEQMEELKSHRKKISRFAEYVNMCQLFIHPCYILFHNSRVIFVNLVTQQHSPCDPVLCYSLVLLAINKNFYIYESLNDSHINYFWMNADIIEELTL